MTETCSSAHPFPSAAASDATPHCTRRCSRTSALSSRYLWAYHSSTVKIVNTCQAATS